MNHLVVQLHQVHVIVNHLVVELSAVGVLDLRGTRGFLEFCILCAQLGVLCLQLCELGHLLLKALSFSISIQTSDFYLFCFGEVS